MLSEGWQSIMSSHKRMWYLFYYTECPIPGTNSNIGWLGTTAVWHCHVTFKIVARLIDQSNHLKLTWGTMMFVSKPFSIQRRCVKGVYMVYILNRPLFSAIKKNFLERKNNSQFYILKLYFLLHYDQFSCSVTRLLNIALQSWCILFKIRKIDIFWPNLCFLLLS